ncbi:MAG TPA: response regulator transcription factor [Phaeodactylibacter sp.]|nr:response regulator transcription factor [Phaeodactylibacter sp.]
MEIWIVEDEVSAAGRLKRMLLEVLPGAEIRTGLDTVRRTVKALREEGQPDVLFLDIHLGDGEVFELFEQVEVSCPVVFATAYDDYAIRAFEVNGLDYLLKPVEKSDLQRVVKKLERLSSPPLDARLLADFLQQFRQQAPVRRRFVIKRGEELKYVDVREVAYFFSEDGYIFLVLRKGERHLIESSLDALEDELSPAEFFRINRKVLLRVEAIDRIHRWFNSRLKISLKPPVLSETIVSRERVRDFKYWLERG